LRKVIIILVIGLIFVGCSATRKGVVLGSERKTTGNILEDIKSQNLTNSNFFIQKGEIEFFSQGENEKFIFTLKFERPDKYLISLKSKTGIEGARIFISGDSIQVNDRINKKLYYGSSIYLVKKFGLSQSFLPLFFGDVILDKGCGSQLVKCIGNKAEFDCQSKGLLLDYTIDCSVNKTLGVSQKNNFGQTGSVVKYGGFFNLENIIVPKLIEFEEFQYNAKIKIKMQKVEYPWKGSINFVPGKDYEIIELL
jgi:hypothetical protein